MIHELGQLQLMPNIHLAETSKRAISDDKQTILHMYRSTSDQFKVGTHFALVQFHEFRCLFRCLLLIYSDVCLRSIGKVDIYMYSYIYID